MRPYKRENIYFKSDGFSLWKERTIWEKEKDCNGIKRVFTLALALMLTCSNLGNIRLFAAESHKLTVTGGTEGTDYKWDGKTLKVLTETSLTISGNNEETGWLLNRADPEEVIEINSE